MVQYVAALKLRQQLGIRLDGKPQWFSEIEKFPSAVWRIITQIAEPWRHDTI